jgi:hypothetical protein
MEGLLKNRVRSLPAQSNRTIARRRRPGVGRLVLASLLLTSGAMLAEVTSVEDFCSRGPHREQTIRSTRKGRESDG